MEVGFDFRSKRANAGRRFNVHFVRVFRKWIKVSQGDKNDMG